MKKTYPVHIFAALGLLMLILDSKTALISAREAIILCQRSVIPTLFPFIVLSNLMVGGLCGASSHLLRPLGKILGIPAGAEGIFLTGILGGYPTGAQVIHEAWKQGGLSTADARRMLGFCNDAGPAFLFGMLTPFFSSQKTLCLLWGIHIVSAMAAGILLPGRSSGCAGTSNIPKTSPTAALKRAVAVMGYICGWVVLFRVVFGFCSRWFLWLLPQEGQVTVYGLLELAGGCCSLDLVADESVRFVICSGILAWGGLCVIMQTASVTGSLGLGQYLSGKLLQTICSLWLSACVVTWGSHYFAPCLLAVPIMAGIGFFLCKKKNNSSILSPIGV